MDDELKSKGQILDSEKKDNKVKDEAREIPDEQLTNIAGGEAPIIRPFS